jgi:cobalt-zinc-cadmium efflux system protein
VNAALDIHVWQLDEHKLFLECKLQLKTNIDHIGLTEIKTMLLDKYDIKHSTIEVNQSGKTLVASCY